MSGLREQWMHQGLIVKVASAATGAKNFRNKVEAQIVLAHARENRQVYSKTPSNSLADSCFRLTIVKPVVSFQPERSQNNMQENAGKSVLHLYAMKLIHKRAKLALYLLLSIELALVSVYYSWARTPACAAKNTPPPAQHSDVQGPGIELFRNTISPSGEKAVFRG